MKLAFGVEDWSLTVEAEVGALALVVFSLEEQTIKSRFDLDKQVFIDEIPIEVNEVDRETLAGLIESGLM